VHPQIYRFFSLFPSFPLSSLTVAIFPSYSLHSESVKIASLSLTRMSLKWEVMTKLSRAKRVPLMNTAWYVWSSTVRYNDSINYSQVALISSVLYVEPSAQGVYKRVKYSNVRRGDDRAIERLCTGRCIQWDREASLGRLILRKRDYPKFV